MKTIRRNHPLPLAALLGASLLVAGCGESREDIQTDAWLILDGHGPMAHDGGGAKPKDSGNKADKGGVVTGSKGKFCNRLAKPGGVKFYMSVIIGSATLKALSGTCSPCLALPVGQQTLSITFEGQPAGSGSVNIEKGKQYVFYSNVSGSSMVIQSAVVPQGQQCENYKPF